MLEEWSLRRLMTELKVALQTIWEELPQEHINKAVVKFTKRLTAYMAVAANVVTLGICSNFISNSKFALSSHHQQTGSSHSHQQTTGEDNAHSAEKWGRCFGWLKQHNFVIFTYILTKLGDKVYFLLLTSCVKFHIKICAHCWNIKKSHRGLLCYWTTLNSSMTFGGGEAMPRA